MNNAINGSTAMGEDSTMAPTHGYGNDGWANLSPYSQSPYSQSPMNEYAAFAYLPHGLPSEPLARMPPPPQPQHHQMIQPATSQLPPPPTASPQTNSTAVMGHQQLPMLTTTWPSQLTNPTPPSGSFSAPPLSLPPASVAPPVEAPRLPAQHEKARKTLSNEQKRAMCLYHEENPGTRQADIGARFGVERSTVSKVLRHKDQYLKRDQEQEQLTKRPKGRNPDFDRTLSNYVRRQQQRGFDVKDDEIMEQAKLFARVSGNSDTILSSLTSNWLQKFKQKHGITGRLLRRASEPNIPDSVRHSSSAHGVSKDAESATFFPVSPTGQLSPLSGSRSDEELQPDGIDFDFTYRSAASHSTTSLTGDLRDNSASNLSGGPMSPTTTFNFSPDPNVGAFTVGGPEFHREKRSNTFPSLNIDYVNQVANNEPATPRHPPAAGTAPSSALESPSSELQQPPFAIDTTLASPPTLRRTSSNSSLTARGISSTPADSSPVSPSQEDARRAANTLLNYISNMSTNGQFDQSEYMAVVQLTKKLQLHQHQSARPSLGGLSRIPEGDGEIHPIGDGTIDPR